MTRSRAWRPALAAVVLLALGAPASADEASNRALVAGVAGRFLAPAYAKLADAASDSAVAWKAYCAGRAPSTLEMLKVAHRELALAFGEVQAFRFGPIGEGSVVERIYFWPERKNATAKGLAGVLAGEATITPQKVQQASAAAQGIPALERLLYAEDGATGPGPGADRACEAGIVIAANLADRTGALSEAWTRPETGIAARLGKGDLDPALAASFELAASSLVTGFATTLAAIQDQKVEPVLGREGIESARPTAAEARLSGLSIEMIVANLAGLRSFVGSLGGSAGTVYVKSWDALLARLQDDARAMQDFPEGVTDPQKRRSVEAFLGRLKSVRAILAQDVPAVLGLGLGFNGMDGD